MYTCFKRAWWKKTYRYPHALVPNSGGRKTVLAEFDTEKEARDF